ncbi:MAG: peptide-methionine (S)-S-oxide reductase, partial [Bacillus sp. (in: Bacteria)]|nr:peptide-methionine (S)-S-oxide reductase [Bacillus sp. (in: firmicutes)]
NDEKKQKAEQKKQAVEKSGHFQKQIGTKIVPKNDFYAAEEYNQDNYKKNPEHYKRNFISSGRATFIEKHWRDK